MNNLYINKYLKYKTKYYQLKTLCGGFYNINLSSNVNIFGGFDNYSSCNCCYSKCKKNKFNFFR